MVAIFVVIGFKCCNILYMISLLLVLSTYMFVAKCLGYKTVQETCLQNYNQQFKGATM